MVPARSHRAWRDLIVGTKPIASSKFGFNLLLTNNRIYYMKDKSEANVEQLIQQTHDFLSKYESLYQVELSQIFNGDYIALSNR
jgi:hypothetical protein